jgi:FKBP-type peptidyl-prolyl cis-trans isomerase
LEHATIKLMKKLIPILALAVIAAIIAGVFLLQNNSTEETSTVPPSSNISLDQEPSQDQPQVTELQSTDLTVGTGAEAATGKTVSVHYTGTLTNGTKFDSSVDRGTPFEFTLGEGRVIQGWEQGVKGMKVGGKRKLVIPPSLGYGSQANGSIPANSTLIFEIELLGVK